MTSKLIGRSLRLEMSGTKFRWRTAKGRIFYVEQMDTKHVFNSMKMCFNHLAEAQGGMPVWFHKHYRDYVKAAVREPASLARTVLALIGEIDRRGDLPLEYQAPYNEIKLQIFSNPRLQNPLPALTAPQKAIGQ